MLRQLYQNLNMEKFSEEKKNAGADYCVFSFFLKATAESLMSCKVWPHSLKF